MSSVLRFEKEGSIASMILPPAFASGFVDRENKYFEFPSERLRSSKICYCVQPFFCSPSDMHAIDAILKEPPHELEEAEILDMIPCMPPGRWAYNGNFQQPFYRTEQISGRTVLAAELKFRHLDIQTYVIFANPSLDRASIDIIWFEAPGKIFEQYKLAVIDSVRSITWRQGD